MSLLGILYIYFSDGEISALHSVLLSSCKTSYKYTKSLAPTGGDAHSMHETTAAWGGAGAAIAWDGCKATSLQARAAVPKLSYSVLYSAFVYWDLGSLGSSDIDESNIAAGGAAHIAGWCSHYSWLVWILGLGAVPSAPVLPTSDTRTRIFAVISKAELGGGAAR